MMFYRRARVSGRAVIDGIIEEVDVRTGRVLFRWSAAQHISTRRVLYTPLQGPLAAVGLLPHQLRRRRLRGQLPRLRPSYLGDLQDQPARGDASGAWAASAATSRLRRTARFGWQHDARFLPDGAISLFDNAAGTGGAVIRNRSTGFVLRVDEARKTVSIVRAITPPGPGAGPQPGQLPAPPQRQLLRRVGPGADRLRVRRRRPAALRSPRCPRSPGAIGPTGSRGRAVPRYRRGWPPHARRGTPRIRLHELERLDWLARWQILAGNEPTRPAPCRDRGSPPGSRPRGSCRRPVSEALARSNASGQGPRVVEDRPGRLRSDRRIGRPRYVPRAPAGGVGGVSPPA